MTLADALIVFLVKALALPVALLVGEWLFNKRGASR